jgi:hypothetical protein
MSDQTTGQRVMPRLLHESECAGRDPIEQEFVFETFVFHIQRAYLEHGFRGVVEMSEKMTAAARAYGVADTTGDINAACKLLYNGYDNLIDTKAA